MVLIWVVAGGEYKKTPVAAGRVFAGLVVLLKILACRYTGARPSYLWLSPFCPSRSVCDPDIDQTHGLIEPGDTGLS